MVEIIPLLISFVLSTFIFIYGTKIKDSTIIILILVSAAMMTYAINTDELTFGAYGAILLMATCGICFVKWVKKCEGWRT